jgi:hypothetical protein
MLLRGSVAAMAAAASLGLATASFAGGEWPDGPNKAWFKNLQRPDNDANPHRDEKSRFCCDIADTVKAKFKVEPGNEKYPEDRWYAWIKDEWIPIPPEKVVKDSSAGRPRLSLHAGRHGPMLRAAQGRTLRKWHDFPRRVGAF